MSIENSFPFRLFFYVFRFIQNVLGDNDTSGRLASGWFDFILRVFLSGTAGFNAVLLNSRDNNRFTGEDVRKALYRTYGFEVKL
jgi:hypothetical protein